MLQGIQRVDYHRHNAEVTESCVPLLEGTTVTSVTCGIPLMPVYKVMISIGAADYSEVICC